MHADVVMDRRSGADELNLIRKEDRRLNDLGVVLGGCLHPRILEKETIVRRQPYRVRDDLDLERSQSLLQSRGPCGSRRAYEVSSTPTS